MDNRFLYSSYELLLGNPEGGNGLKVVGDEQANDGLQLQFTVEKAIDNKSKGNRCEFKLTNLSEDTINYIQKKDMPVVFHVGYNNNNKFLFGGVSSEVITDDSSSGTDRITTIRCVPSDSFLYTPIISRTFPPETTPRTIINFLIGQSPTLSKASFNSSKIDQAFPFGYPAEGSIKSILNELSRDFDFYYRIDGNRIYVNDANKFQSTNSRERAFVLSPNSGLIGRPSRTTDKGSKAKTDETSKEGVKFKALMNPLLQPGQAVSLKDTYLEGTYRIDTATFTGDWRTGGWEVECQCSTISATEV